MVLKSFVNLMHPALNTEGKSYTFGLSAIKILLALGKAKLKTFLFSRQKTWWA